MSGKEHKIIVKRSVKGKHGHHGGGWKIAYADFMTAMMAFFLVMWLLSISTPKQLTGIAEYFRMPLKVAITGGPKSSMSSSVIPGGGGDPTKKDGEVMRSSPDSNDAKRLRELKKRLEDVIDANPVLKQFRPQLLLELTPDGLRIQIIDSQNRPMFKLASATLEPYMSVILREIGPVLNDLPNGITLSGHTDALRYVSGEKSYSNWELSADRANASRRELVAGGMNDVKVLRVTGVSSAMPFNRSDPKDPANRRISIMVLNKRAQQRIEQENSDATQGGLELSEKPDPGAELRHLVPVSNSAPKSGAVNSAAPTIKKMSQG